MVKVGRLVVIGGGWAGLSAAVAAQRQGWQVTLLEASPHWGGRARRLELRGADAQPCRLDNGQHLLMGAYTATLGLLGELGVALPQQLQRVPLTLAYPDGGGLRLPRELRWWPSQAAALAAAVARVRGWSWSERLGLLRWAAHWHRRGWTCAPELRAAELAAPLPPRVVAELLQPLAVAALNTPWPEASAAVLLRVLHDALHGPAHPPYAASDLLLPREDLGTLLPDAATAWLARQGADLRRGTRVRALQRRGEQWTLMLADGHCQAADAVVLATPAWEAARLMQQAAVDPVHAAQPVQRWLAWAEAAAALRHVAIATVYLEAPAGWRWRWPQPMLALRSDPLRAPAQFAFCRCRGDDQPPVLALVVSAPAPEWAHDRAGLTLAVQRQAQDSLIAGRTVRVLATVVERRATFACTPGLQRPDTVVAAGLMAAGDYVHGPYPATLEGAVRSGLAAVKALAAAR